MPQPTAVAGTPHLYTREQLQPGRRNSVGSWKISSLPEGVIAVTSREQNVMWADHGLSGRNSARLEIRPRREHDGGTLILLVEREGRVVGRLAIAVHAVAPLPRGLDTLYRFDLFTAIPRDGFATASEYWVDPAHRDGDVPQLLTIAGFCVAIENGAQITFVDVPISRKAAAARFGFRTYTRPLESAGDGYRLPLFLLMYDLEHLRGVRSPLAPYSEEALSVRRKSLLRPVESIRSSIENVLSRGALFAR